MYNIDELMITSEKSLKRDINYMLDNNWKKYKIV